MKLSRNIPAAAFALLAFAAVASSFAGPSHPQSKEEKKAVKDYPLDTCIVSGEKLGEMGKPVSFVHDGQEIKLCCKGCRKDFDKDPGKYLKELKKK